VVVDRGVWARIYEATSLRTTLAKSRVLRLLTGGLLVRVAPRKQTRWRPQILHAQLPQLEALIREQADRTLAELQEALATPASLPTICRAVKRLGFRFRKNGTRVRTRSR